MHHDALAAWQFRNVRQQARICHVEGLLKMPHFIFRSTAHIQDERTSPRCIRFSGTHFWRGLQLDATRGDHGIRRNHRNHAVIANSNKVPNNLVRSRQLTYQDDSLFWFDERTNHHWQHLSQRCVQRSRQMTISECRPRPRVHHHRPGRLPRCCMSAHVRYHGRHRNSTKRRNPIAVQRLHARKVKRRLGLARQDVFHECGFVTHQFQHWTVGHFISNRGLRNGAKCLATSAPGSVRWPHLQVPR